MGNKSKHGAGKWSPNIVAARLPKNSRSWMGLQPRTIAPLKRVRITGGHVVAGLTAATRVNRQFAARMALPPLARGA